MRHYDIPEKLIGINKNSYDRMDLQSPSWWWTVRELYGQYWGQARLFDGTVFCFYLLLTGSWRKQKENGNDISLVSSNKQQNNAGQNSMANSYFQQARPASRWEQDQHNESQLYQQTTDQSHHLWGSNISYLPQGSVVSIERGFNEDIKIRTNKINFQHVKESMVLTRHLTEKQI